MGIRNEYAISFTRCIAMVSIVLCHFWQHYGSNLAWIFNFGVQMFLFVSGYLYSEKQIVNVLVFYKKNAKKLLVDYYIYIFIFIAVIALPGGMNMERHTVFNMLILKDFPLEIGQFWFLPYILLCYGITPLLHAVLDEIDKRNGVRYLLSCVLLLCFVEVPLRNFFPYFAPVWIDSYILGMIIRRCKYKKETFWKRLNVLLWICCAITNGMILWIGFSYLNQLAKPQLSLFYEWFHYSHMLLGICSVLFLHWMFRLWRQIPPFLTAILDWSDTYSYDIYIVHNLFIQGTYSALKMVESKVIGILLACVLTLVSGMLLNKASQRCKEKLFSPKGIHST